MEFVVRKNNIIIVIPSRLKSKRLPNKPLLLIHGKPMIIWVADRIKKLNIDYIVATDSKEIMKECLKNDHKAILTPKKLNSGTDRIAYLSKNYLSRYKYFINVQGDEPLINLQNVKKIIENTERYKNAFITAISKIKNKKNNKSFVKVALTKNNKILYLSRSPIPYNEKQMTRFKIVGIYSYSKSFLNKFSQIKIGKIENFEKIEQLRCIEGELDIYGVEVGKSFPSIDTIDDLRYFRKLSINYFKKT